MTRVLIVDDEEKIREMICKYAKHEGFETDEASDGMIAVEKCETNAYDLIVMDVMMPNLDGFSAVKEIKKIRPNMPFIMLSALGEEYDRVHGFDIGVDDYVVKPFSSKELMMRKNHDYGEAWREMSKEGIVDMIMAKIIRIKTILEHGGTTIASEGVEGNYFDIINYAIFDLIHYGNL